MCASIQHFEIHGLKHLLGVFTITSTTRHRPTETVGVCPLELSFQLDIVHCTLLGFGVSENEWREGSSHMTGTVVGPGGRSSLGERVVRSPNPNPATRVSPGVPPWQRAYCVARIIRFGPRDE